MPARGSEGRGIDEDAGLAVGIGDGEAKLVIDHRHRARDLHGLSPLVQLNIQRTP